MVSEGGGEQLLDTRITRLLSTADTSATYPCVPTLHVFGISVHDLINHLHPGASLESKKICTSLFHGKCLLHRWVSLICSFLKINY